MPVHGEQGGGPHETRAGFDPRRYWEERLRRRYDLQGVGFSQPGRPYNEWLYRIRRRVFRRVVRRFDLAHAGVRVLDVGSGTGFYVDRWREVGVRDVVASDLTSVAVTRLRERYPDVDVVSLDIGAPALPPGLAGRFDVVSAFDVFFHILDEDRHAQACANAGHLLTDGGWFLLSDVFLAEGVRRSANATWRSLGVTRARLEAARLDIVGVVPVFALMHRPPGQGWRARLWDAAVYPVERWPHLGQVLGGFLYPVDLLLTRALRRGPSTEILVCRKRSAHHAGTGLRRDRT